MKKLLFPVAIAATIAFASCSGTGASSTSADDFKAKIENCTNTDSLKAYVNDAKAYVQKLVDEGKIDEAKKYINEIEPVVKDKAPALAGTFEAVKTVVDKIPSKTSDAVDSAKNAVSNASDSVAAAASAVKDDAAQKLDKAKDAVADKAVEVKDAVVDKTVEVKDAVVKKATEVTDATKDKVNDIVNK